MYLQVILCLVHFHHPTLYPLSLKTWKNPTHATWEFMLKPSLKLPRKSKISLSSKSETMTPLLAIYAGFCWVASLWVQKLGLHPRFMGCSSRFLCPEGFVAKRHASSCDFDPPVVWDFWGLCLHLQLWLRHAVHVAGLCQNVAGSWCAWKAKLHFQERRPVP